MEHEKQFDFRDKGAAGGSADIPSCVEVEDNGADTTLICFAGMAALYAAMPKFEFRKTLVSTDVNCNFIWVRDIHRSGYNLAPDGSPDGFGYYTRSIGEALAGLKPSHAVAIGASGGGAAAFAFSGTLPVAQVIAFNPAFPPEDYGSAANRRAAILNCRKLLRAPRDYFEIVLLTLSARYLWRRLCRLVGEENILDVTECYLRKSQPVRAVVIYSDDCAPDAELALRLKDIPEVTLVPVPSGRHNCMAELKHRGELAPLIHRHIRAGLARNPAQ
jgi:pimeloyl-ACP methyl ester carboxylesterase